MDYAAALSHNVWGEDDTATTATTTKTSTNTSGSGTSTTAGLAINTAPLLLHQQSSSSAFPRQQLSPTHSVSSLSATTSTQQAHLQASAVLATPLSPQPHNPQSVPSTLSQQTRQQTQTHKEMTNFTSPAAPSRSVVRVYRNQEVRVAFREAASSHSDVLTLSTLPEVLVKLSLSLPLDELTSRFPYDAHRPISYDEFIAAMGDVLFGHNESLSLSLDTAAPAATTTTTGLATHQLTAAERLLSPLRPSSDTTAAAAAEERSPANNLASWMSDLLSMGRDALSAPVPIEPDVYGELLTEEDPEEAGVGGPIFDERSLIQKMKDASEVERRELRQDREVALAKLQQLNDDLGLTEEQYMNLQSVTQAIVEAFRAKQQEIDRQRELAADLIQRLRQKNAMQSDLQTDNYQSRTMKLIEDLKVAINDPKIKNPASDKEFKAAHDACTRLLNQCALSAQQEAEMRRGIAEDNGWLWMQMTQLQKQLEQQFVARSEKAAEQATCVIQ